MARWIEPFINYGPDCNRATPFYDAALALGRRARELLSPEGVQEPRARLPSLYFSSNSFLRHEPPLLAFTALRELRSNQLEKM